MFKNYTCEHVKIFICINNLTEQISLSFFFRYWHKIEVFSSFFHLSKEDFWYIKCNIFIDYLMNVKIRKYPKLYIYFTNF